MTAPLTIPILDAIETLVGEIDVMIFDIWGVVHDGVILHTDAQTAIQTARDNGIKTVFFTNAPRARFFVANQLKSLGLADSLTDHVVTSGGLARDDVRTQYGGKKLYHLGPDSDHDVLVDLDVILVNNPDDANVILATGMDFKETEDHRHWLATAARKGVPFLCANPDRIVHVGDKLIACAGAVADLYEQMGGPAIFYGKPGKSGFMACLAAHGLSLDGPTALDPSRVLMVGDSARTDIAGARAMGFRSLLIASGIHRDTLMPLIDAQAKDGGAGFSGLSAPSVAAALAPHTALPDYIMPILK